MREGIGSREGGNSYQSTRLKMKRESRKTRSLRYIRDKNFYRLGGRALLFFKLSNELIADTEYLELFAKEESKGEIERLQKKFKMPFRVTGFKTEIVGNDFIRGLVTGTIFIQRLPLPHRSPVKARKAE